MSVPSMVHRSGDSLVVRSVVSGDALFGTATAEDADDGEELAEIVAAEDLPECKIKRNYSCPNCDYFTQNPRNFLYHLRDVHKEKVKIYECPNCLYASKHYQKLLRHAKMVHGSADGIELPRGKKRNIEDSEQEQEIDDSENDDEETKFKCSHCTFTSKNQNVVNKHEKDEHLTKIKSKFFKCSKCSYTTPIKARFTKHTKYHSMPMIKCDLCDFKTPYKWNLDRHCKNHNGTGIYRCSACNFTADIKQSLTVHEMNHHVPPVGQAAAGIGVGKRRNKVGASDTMANEEGSPQQVESTTSTNNTTVESSKKSKKLKPPTDHHQSRQANAYGSDFINPEDIIHHANGQIYIKNKCKLCNYKSAWDGEMAKHEEKVHNIIRNNNNNIFRSEKKKTSKPLPNLIPLHQPSKVPQQFCQPTNMNTLPIPQEPIYSQKDINDICAKSMNSDLKDFASLIDSDVFKNVRLDLSTPTPKIPDLIPTSSFSKKPSKNSSFFDKFKANLTADNLRCDHCGHESKCLTEFDAHKKICGHKARAYNPSSPIPRHNLSSTRCQFCRQRCKSSTDLINHLKTCREAAKSLRESEDLKDDDDDNENNNSMENRIFVWNNIQVPMDIDIQNEDVNEDIQYEYIEEKQDDNISLDLSIRTQSPNSENSFLSIEPSNPTPTPSSTPTTTAATPSSTTTEKIPTHGNDISIAQHKRVFKCPHCTFWASTASRFHVHIVGHLNKKPFECSLCSYRSNWRWDITKHIKLKSVRDPAHESAKVLMTDETGRRNYTKYNKYLTEINVGGDNETSGGSGTRPKSSSNHHHDHQSSPSQVLPNSSQKDVSRLNHHHHHRTSSNNSSFFNSNDFNNVAQQQQKTTRPVPSLKVRSAVDLFKYGNDKKKNGSENKKTLWQCKKCNFRDPSKEKLLAHVKTHYVTSSSSSLNDGGGEKSVVDRHHQQQSPTNHQQQPPADHQQLDEASVGGGYSRLQAPFRCGHCQQVSNWKHVIQRHCRLKHSGDIRVVIGSKNGPDKIEVEEGGQQEDEDSILPQDIEMEELNKNESEVTSCSLCNYHVANRNEYIEHLRLHGISDPEDYLINKNERIDSGEIPKRYQCTICPYDTNSKSQFLYHKQFHSHQGYQYTCKTCGYNVSKRHLLHQHMKVHNNNFKQQNGGDNSDDGILIEFEEVEQFGDIPLVWVSKNGKFAKMYKCRYCPHVNLRKVNIQDHEKMHGNREKNSTKSSNSEIEHRCPDCNYVCNNAGVLSSHSKVHQGLYGKIHGLVDLKRSDDEQIKEFKEMFSGYNNHDSDEEMMGLVIDFNEENQSENNFESSSSVLYFCEKCPARFLKENEFLIHLKFHGARLIYKCDHCSYTARQQPHILAHNNVHSDEYQKRTAIFKGTYCAHPDYQPPKVFRKEFHGEFINVVLENNDLNNKVINIDMENEPECSIALNKTMKFTQNVPLSGTELFQQKNEAQLNYSSTNQATISSSISSIPSSSRSDPQFGSLILGNPEFVYPTCIKNGKTKEKRYKCHKCPSAFEKREQYKVHLGLHGAKSKYNCAKCDYSVKYYANYTQHIKKHQINDEAVFKKLPENEDKKFFYCTNCPYSNQRKDSLDNHMKKHGSNNVYTCEHCDYSVPQAHVLRDHIKLHFAEKQKGVHVDGYMVCDNIKLTSKKLNQSDHDDDEKETDDNDDDEENNDSSSTSEESIVFDEKTDENTDLVGGGNNLNNNKGERVFVNPDTGEFAVDLSKVNETTVNESNVDSQVSSDN